MGLTKAEKKKYASFKKRANKIGNEAYKLARDVDKELRNQMRKS